MPLICSLEKVYDTCSGIYNIYGFHHKDYLKTETSVLRR